MKRTGSRRGLAAAAVLACCVALAAAAGCKGTTKEAQAGEGGAEQAEQAVYAVELRPLNAPHGGQGKALIRVKEDSVVFTVQGQQMPAGIMHLQHLHGKTDGSEATCPPPEADANGDGFIDLLETEPYSGVTMIPLHDEPVSLEIKTETYPVASDLGSYEYTKEVPLEPLRQAMQQKFGLQSLDWGRMVFMVHTVPETTRLPETVQSLPGVPAHLTLPIACGAPAAAQGQ